MYGWGSSLAGAVFNRPLTLTPWRLKRAADSLKRRSMSIGKWWQEWMVVKTNDDQDYFRNENKIQE